MTPARDATNREMITGGCVMAMGSAVLTCVMLFVNGSLVWAVLSAFSRSGPAWTRKPEFSQFILFLFPVLLVMAEWMMIDYVRSRFRHRNAGESEEIVSRRR